MNPKTNSFPMNCSTKNNSDNILKSNMMMFFFKSDKEKDKRY